MPSPITLFGIHFQLPSNQETIALVLLVFYGLFSVLELLMPRQKLSEKSLRQSFKTNISLFLFNSAIMSLLSVSSLFMLAQHYSHQGLLRYLSNPFWQAVLSFVLLDLLLYLWHKACHSFDSLWMFHRVHHNDPYLNTSTSFRVHILELLLTNLLKAFYIITLGVDQLMVLANEMVMTLSVMFHHSNISFKAEKLLGKFIIVPALHRTHHSTQRNEHDSNYGFVLSLWDWLFGTLQERGALAIGIDGNSPQDAIGLIKFGFTQIKPPATAPRPVNLNAMIAEAAYYKAEKRHFSPGYELLDWLEAKKEIIKSAAGENAAMNYQLHQFE